jgi:excinuclease UvrABC ATPase subunit
MKLFLLLTLVFMTSAHAQDFETEAKTLAQDLKSSLMKNLSEKMAKDGAVKAISFCHENVKPIAKLAAKDRVSKFEFGRTSHKIRNEANAPQAWANVYLKEFQGTFKGDIKKEHIIHKLENSKRVYLEPLYVQAQCLTCHGESIAPEIKTKLAEIYPQDKATGFKLGEFRGFIWIKEK